MPRAIEFAFTAPVVQKVSYLSEHIVVVTALNGLRIVQQCSQRKLGLKKAAVNAVSKVPGYLRFVNRLLLLFLCFGYGRLTWLQFLVEHFDDGIWRGSLTSFKSQ